VHDDLGRKNQTTRYILPCHWLYEWFAQFRSCGTYSVLSRSHSVEFHNASFTDVSGGKRARTCKTTVWSYCLCQSVVTFYTLPALHTHPWQYVNLPFLNYVSQHISNVPSCRCVDISVLFSVWWIRVEPVAR